MLLITNDGEVCQSGVIRVPIFSLLELFESVIFAKNVHRYLSTAKNIFKISPHVYADQFLDCARHFLLVRARFIGNGKSLHVRYSRLFQKMMNCRDENILKLLR